MKKLKNGLISCILCITLIGCGNNSEKNTVSLKKAYDNTERDYIIYYLEKNKGADEGSAKEKYAEIATLSDDYRSISVLVYDFNDDSSEDADKLYDDIFKAEIENAVQAMFISANLNEELKLPESLLQKIQNTSPNDIKQTERYDDITVTWAYYECGRFEIIYEKD